jgi:hypothetical protein
MMNTTEQSAIVGVFENRDDAEAAVVDLQRAGFTASDLGYMGHGDVAPAGVKDASDEAEDTGKGAASGAIGGGVLGGVLGAVAAGLIPGVGPIIGAGILAATLGGAAAGAAAGGLIGALTGLGVSDDDARYYDDEFRAGRTLVTVRGAGRADEARSILRRHGAYDVETRRRAA